MRGIKTLAIRMEKAQSNALQIVDWLCGQKAVVKVIYPGMKTHPGYEVMCRQSRGFGAMITFELESKEFALSILEKVKLIRFAESLGGVETLITYPITQTHADVPKDILARNGITDRLLRMSVGIEEAQDLIQELDEVFRRTEEELHGGKKS
jgi:cystathionine gamma-synthase